MMPSPGIDRSAMFLDDLQRYATVESPDQALNIKTANRDALGLCARFFLYWTYGPDGKQAPWGTGNQAVAA